MLRLLNNEIAIGNDFSATFLYNHNRNKGNYREMDFLEYCINNNLLNVRKYKIKPYQDISVEIRGKDYELLSILEGYPRENKIILAGLFNICKLMDPYVNLELNRTFDTNLGSVRPRLYIPEYNLALNPTTQTIDELLVLCASECNVCIVDCSIFDGITAYYIEKDNEYLSEILRFKEQLQSYIVDELNRVGFFDKK